MEKTFGALNKMTEGRKCGECVKNSPVEGFFFKSVPKKRRARERGSGGWGGGAAQAGSLFPPVIKVTS